MPNTETRPEIMFYHALETDKNAVLFTLLKKSLSLNKRVIIRTIDLESAQNISDDLWQAQADFILPHGLICEPMADKQPVLITYHTENVNQADYIFFLGAVDVTDFTQYERCIVIFDEHSDTIKAHMRQQFKMLKENQQSVNYYQQRQGKWHLS